MAGFIMRTVITGKNHESRLIDPSSFQVVKNAAYITIHPGDHRSLSLIRVWPIFGRIDAILWHFCAIAIHPRAFIICVRNGQRQIKEKWLFPVTINELDRLVHEQIMRVIKTLGCSTTTKPPVSSPRLFNNICQRFFVCIVPNKFRIIIMGVHLVQIAKKAVESFSKRETRLMHLTEAPLTNKTVGVSHRLKNFCNRRILCTQGLFQHCGTVCIASHMRVPHVLSCQEHASTGSTDRVARIKLRELHSLLSHLIKPGSCNHFLTKAPHIAVAQVVSHDKNQIGLRRNTRLLDHSRLSISQAHATSQGEKIAQNISGNVH